MTKSELLRVRLPEDKLVPVCRRWEVARLWAFGSVLGDFRADSDIDLLVEFQPGARIGLLEHLDLQDELAAVLGKPVDLVERSSLENPFIRQGILESCVQVYAA